jgi:hypothetical protein
VKSARYGCALAVALLLAGCGSKAADDATPPPAASSSATPSAAPLPQVPNVPFRDYLTSINVTAQPLPIAEATGLEVTVPVPDGWVRANEPLFAAGLEFIRQIGVTGNAPSASLMAIRLDGAFDPKVAIEHANTDALPPRATDVTQSFDDYKGLPSAQAQGVSDGAEHYSRFVIATVPQAGTHYLVQLTVTNPSGPIAQSPPLTQIIDGFTVTTK